MPSIIELARAHRAKQRSAAIPETTTVAAHNTSSPTLNKPSSQEVPQTPPKPATSTPPSKNHERLNRSIKLKERLPVGSAFAVQYVKHNSWNGTLTVPDKDGGAPHVFTGNHRAVFKLLIHLDRLYRTFLEPKEIIPSPESGAV